MTLEPTVAVDKNLIVPSSIHNGMDPLKLKFSAKLTYVQ
jgi:hypothetical protein